MDAVDAARRVAESVHRALVEKGADPWHLLDFVMQEASRRDIVVYGLPPDDPQLKGGQAVFDRQACAILYADGGTDFDRAFLIAHELGHVALEGGSEDVVTLHVEPDRSVEDAPVGIEKVLDYGARERREIRMDLFARELLLPRSVAVALHVRDGMSAAAIAERLRARTSMVQQQLLDALLLPPSPETDLAPPSSPPPAEDPSQLDAA
ncbi:MAG: ImmA/IrrE family metallo-endopeptidase [Opitutus sp.]